MLSLTCAISEYDHVRDLASGRVTADGISLTCLSMPVEEIFFRMLRHREFDIAEMSMGRYASIASRDDCPFVAIPVFPSRMFRHSSIYVRTDGPVHQPNDLKGKRVGVPEWAQTAGIYTRGILGRQFGLGLRDVEWVQAGIHQSGREEEVAVNPPPGVSIVRYSDRTLSDMLLAGEIDAMISAHPPGSFEAGDSSVRRLFDDFIDIERRYWHEEKIFPIMHTVVLRRDVFESSRWIAMNLLKAFEEAKHRSMERISEATAARVPLPWAFEHVRRIRAEFGDDFWPYGLEPNRTTLAAFLGFAFEQGVTKRKVSPEELFPSEVQSRFRI
ncbi:MAG: 4,5-dihydroxyphthalate decarboxylase [Xanthobacteraceae bacterium]|nr:4,5-dihydroxyphthalate decarboxylase [Xanthobacteraceae bacterium]